ncbi:MAG: JAB-like toxin 1 domain-containing protein [Bacteroidota bacterium]
MKRILSLLVLLLFIGTTYAQNPFEKFGYTPKIGTLSKGKYIEHFDTDSIVQIGSVLFNPFTKKITGFVTHETVYSEATLKPEIVSRWMTPDPLTEEREWVNPYNFVQNNPIIRTDPTGLLDTYGVNQDGDVVWLDDTTYLDENGNEVDRLYAIDENNNIVDSNSEQEFATATVDEGTGTSFLSELASDNTGADYGVTSNLSDALGVFKFAADNSKVEFGVQGFQLDNGDYSYVVGTSRSPSYAFNAYHLGLSGGYSIENLQFDLHSHPNQAGASGYGTPKPSGDRERQFGHYNILGQSGRNLSLHYYIYHTPTQGLYRYGPRRGDEYIGTIKKPEDFVDKTND